MDIYTRFRHPERIFECPATDDIELFFQDDIELLSQDDIELLSHDDVGLLSQDDLILDEMDDIELCVENELIHFSEQKAPDVCSVHLALG